MRYYDAHNHLHDARLIPHRDAIWAELQKLPLNAVVVNGTRESDWSDVLTLASEESIVRPSLGLHPWHVPQRTPHWFDTLQRLLEQHPHAYLGEIGLDRWIEGHDLVQQSEVFTAQLALAAERNIPTTIHCLRAWGALWDILRENPVPECGFLLHAYGGPAEMIDGFVNRGGYFSFSPSFLQERKAAQREAFRIIPSHRLLVETDAPDLRPPDEHNPHPLHGPDGHPINHPANIIVAYAALAEVRESSLETLATQIEENFHRLFQPTT